MPDFVKGLLGESSVNKMAEAMQVAPRQHPRDVVDRPTRSEKAEQAEQTAQQAPAQPTEEEQAAAYMEQKKASLPQGQAPQPYDGPMLEDDAPEGVMEADDAGAFYPPNAEEEKQARMLIANAVNYIYGDGLESLAKLMKSEGDVSKAVGKATAILVGREIDAAEAGGVQVSPNILLSAGAEIVSQMYELAEALGLWDSTGEQADRDMSRSLNYAATLFAEEQVQTGRKDRLQGLDQAVADIQAGKYDSQPGRALPDEVYAEEVM